MTLAVVLPKLCPDATCEALRDQAENLGRLASAVQLGSALVAVAVLVLAASIYFSGRGPHRSS